MSMSNSETSVFLQKRALLMVILGGVLYAASYPHFHQVTIPFANHLGFALLLLCLKDISRIRPSLALLCLWGLGYGIMGYNWLPQTFELFGNLSAPWNYILWIVMAPVLVFHWAVVIILWKGLEKKFPQTLPRFESRHPRLFALSLSLLFLLSEIFLFQQFPAQLGHTWMDLSPYLAPTPFFGSHLYSFLGYYLICSLLIETRKGKIDFLPILTLVFFLLWGLISPLPGPESSNEKLPVRVVQGNIGSLMKVDAETGNTISYQKVLNTYYELSLAPRVSPPHLIIWPETAYPEILISDETKKDPNLVPELIKNLTQKTGADFFIGTYDEEKGMDASVSFENQFNAAMLFSKEGKLIDSYRKVKLLPFGETLPFGPLNKFLSQYITNISYFSKGDRYPLFKTSSGHTFIGVICYELLFSDFIANYIDRHKVKPNLIINLTNDSWFGKSFEPFQHLYLAKWRALEFDIPVVRSTNTGVTSVIYPDGSESERLPWYEKGNLDLDIPLNNRPPTLFQKYGRLPLLGLIFLFILLARFLPTNFLRIQLLANRES